MYRTAERGRITECENPRCTAVGQYCWQGGLNARPSKRVKCSGLEVRSLLLPLPLVLT
jgi:hypothetical protein